MPAARSGIARRYAEAVFELARANSTFDRWSTELAEIAQLQRDPRVGKLLASPAVGISAKEAVLVHFSGEWSREAGNLARLLLHKGRFPLASQIADHYRQLVNKLHGIATAEVVSAVPLSQEEIRAVATKLSDMTGRTVIVESSVDPSIIGGIVARVGDELIDASVKGRLEALKRQLEST